MVRRVNLLPSSRLFVTALCVAFCSAASAQSTDSVRVAPIPRSPFRIAQSFALSPAPTSVAGGDLNGDGHADLVVTRAGSGSVSVLLGNGKGGFSAGTGFPAGTTVSNALVADFNGDGRLDVAVTDSSSGSVVVLFGNGDGTLGAPQVYAALKNPVSLAAGRFTGSGKVDLAVASSTGVAVLFNDGTGKFSSASAVPVSVQPVALAAADLKGAGHDDLILTSQNGSLTVLASDGTGRFAPQTAVPVAAGPLSSIATGDFNADGKADLAVSQGSSNAVTVLLGKGDGTFQAGAPYVVGNGPAKVIAANLTGSGALDLVTLNQLSNTFSVLAGNGDGTFRPSIDFVAGNLPLGAVAADFNGDGKADLAIANSQDQNIAVPLGKGDGTFAATRSYRADLASKAVAAGDLNGDGRSDLVVINYCGADASCASNGSATIFLANTDGSYRAGSTLALGSGPLAVTLADLHGAGKLDLIALNGTDKTLSILAGHGDGTFGAAQAYTLSASPRAVLAADFNGDGKTDLAIASDCGQSACSQPGTLDIWLGHGDGSLSASASYTVGFAPVSIAAADLRSTGHLDILVANSCGSDSSCKLGTGSIFTNDGTGKLTAAGEVTLGSAPSAIALGNLSGSGLDLAVALRGSNQVAVLHSNGNGTFAAPVAYAAGTAPSALAIADFNGDGQLDLAVANAQSSNVSVLYGLGGKLQTATNYPVAANPESLVAIAGGAGRAAGIVTTNGSTASPMGGGATPLGGGGANVSTTALAAPTPNPSTVNQSVTLTATVTGDGTDGAPTGNVVFAIDNGGSTTPISDCAGATGEALTNIDTNNAHATCTTQVLTAAGSPISLQAQYQGDTVYATSDSADQTQNVDAADTTTTVTSVAPATPIVDQSATFSATVAPASGTAVVPFSGTMSFSADGTAIAACSAQAVGASTGVATCPYSGLSAGPHSITATYNNDLNYNTSTSTGFAVTVNKAATAVTVNSASPSSPTVDQVVTVTATVAPGTGSAIQPFSGTMAFSLGGTTITGCAAQAVNSSTGVATCTISAGLSVGPRSITAAYNSGDSNYNASPASGALAVTVAKAATQASISPSASSINVGQSVTFTATVTPNVTGTEVATGSIVTLNGTVLFADNGTTITGCSAQSVTFASGAATATCTTSSLTGGTHSNLTATYSGDASYTVSPASPATTVTVGKATPTVAVTSNPTTPTLNNPVTYTAAITFPTPLTITPGGTVLFSDNGVTITGCSAQSISVTGTANIYQATCTQSSITGGNHAIIATYSGDANYGSTSGNLSLNISAASTTTSVTSSQNPSTVNSSVGFTVSVHGGTSTAVTGTATVTADGTNNLGQCTLSGWTSGTGTASCTVSSTALALGSHPVAAAYSGDSNYSSSTGNLSSNQVVNAATTSLALASSLNPSVVNQSVAFTATLTFPSGGTALSGTVAFTDNGTTIPGCGAVTPTVSGTAVCNDTALTASGTAHTIKATFTDSHGNFSTSNATLGGGQTVSAASGTIALGGSPNPSSYNQSVTFTATVSVPTGGVAPSGTVKFTDSVTAAAIPGCASVALNSNNIAQCVTSALANGSHTITASYSGDTNFTVTSANVSQSVGAASTSVNISSSVNPSVANQAVTFTATVSSASQGSAQFTGTMLFQANGTTIAGCAAVAVNGTSGQAGCSTSTLLVGSDTITAVYSGDSSFAGSSNTLVQKVNASTGSNVVLTSSSSAPIEAGTQVTYTATITPAYTGGIPLGGAMVFTDTFVNQSGSTTITLCSVTAGTGTFIAVGAGAGVATCKYTLPDGTNSVTASYVNDSNFSATPSTALTQLVQDYSIAVAPVPANATGVVVTQGTGSAASPDPYPSQAVSVTPTSISGYTGTLALTCKAVPSAGAPACSLANSNLSVVTTGTQASDAIALDATGASVGTYVFTVTATDANSVIRTFSFPVTVRSESAALTVVSGATTNNVATVQFQVPANVSLPKTGTTFACVSVVGPELTGTYTPAQLSIGCSFNPATIPTSASAQIASVGVTISTTGTTSMNQPAGLPGSRSNGLLVAGLFGIPVFGFLGFLGGSKRTRTIFLRVLAVVAIAAAGWQVMGCGGSFTGTSTNTGGKTPPGVYNILVQGTGSDGGTYQAVVKLNVTL